MSTVDVLRPVSVRKTGGGTAVPSGTEAVVTSDNSDATYVQFPAANSGDNWSVRVASHIPATGYQRHQVRGRIRIGTNVGTATDRIDLGRGTSDWIEFDTVPASAAITEQTGGWYQDGDYGLDTSGALADLNIGAGWFANAAGAATETRSAELYVDIDCRFRPDYAPEVQDAAGDDQSGGTVTDTNQPTLAFGAVTYDSLPPLDWAVAVQDASDAVVFSSNGVGTAPTSVPVTVGLDDGAYTVTFEVRSLIRGTDPFPYSVVQSFSVQNTVPPPSPPNVDVEPEAGGYRVTWTNPGGQPWDDDFVVAEVWRTDCTGTSRIATVDNAINGSYLDLAVPQIDEVDCETSTPCDITYQVRYWGYVSTFIVLPDTIPADMILGWPGTAAAIPSGWSRVTGLDGVYPMGSNGTAAPTATGGAASHSHTTPGHVHTFTAHTHSLGGSTGSSNTSTTSARFNGASQPQADQPHTHGRPGSVGASGGGNSSSTSPGTDTVANVPPTREVIWIHSDGAQPNYPVGILGWATETVSGWNPDTSSAGRFLKGAAATGDGGAVSGASSHTHTVAAHMHNGPDHVHSIANTGLSNPASSQEAGTGSGTPRWLPRHTHPMSVANANTGTLGSVDGGVTSAASLDPPNRRLSVLVNAGGGTQTRIIGLYTGAVADLDPLLTLCDGSAGTPDMRTWFARDTGSDSIGSTGGASTHTHTTGTHAHFIGTHAHDTNVGVSSTGSFLAPGSGDLGDSPTTGHTHTSGDTGDTRPTTGAAASGTTGAASNVPPYKEAHFVRLDGTISGDPLAVPVLKVSDFSSVIVPSLVHTDDLDRLASFTDLMAVATTRSSSFPRLVTDSTPLEGGLHTVSDTAPGEDLSLTIAVVGRSQIDRLETLLASDRVYWSPIGGTPGWFAPQGWSVAAPVPDVKVVTITMTRQPWPTTPDPSEFL